MKHLYSSLVMLRGWAVFGDEIRLVVAIVIPRPQTVASKTCIVNSKATITQKSDSLKTLTAKP